MTEEVVWQGEGCGVTKQQIVALVEQVRARFDPPDGTLAWATVRTRGTTGTLIDALPCDGNVLVDLYPDRIVLRVQQTHSGRPSGPRVDAYAAQLAQAIQDALPAQPPAGAPIRDWSRYRMRQKEARLRPPTYAEVAKRTGYSANSLRQDFYTLRKTTDTK